VFSASSIPTELNDLENGSTEVSCVRILVADDNSAVLDHVSNMLQPDYEIVGKIADGNSVCQQVLDLRPDLTILDISMGEHSGIDIAQRLREEGYVGEIIFLTVHEDPAFVSAAIGAGGRGYVIKSRMNVDLRPAVNAVLAHRIFVSPPLQQL
jgi:DNA-binding NarL/FixJ family response regulator